MRTVAITSINTVRETDDNILIKLLCHEFVNRGGGFFFTKYYINSCAIIYREISLFFFSNTYLLGLLRNAMTIIQLSMFHNFIFLSIHVVM